jgi:hypothetical protein
MGLITTEPFYKWNGFSVRELKGNLSNSADTKYVDKGEVNRYCSISWLL